MARPASDVSTFDSSIPDEVVDDSNVDVLRFPVAGSTDVEEFRFPKAGSNNSLSRLRIVQVGFKAMLMFSSTYTTLSSSSNSNHE